MLNLNKITRSSEYLLGILALLGIFTFLQISMNTELRDPDIWLHLKTGEYIIQNHAVPQVDIYSATNLGKPWIDHSALTQVIFVLIFNYFATDGLLIFSSVLMLLAFLLLFFSTYQDRSKLYLSTTVLALTILASRTRFNIRPENFSVLFFCAFLFVLARFKNKKLIFILPLIQLAWVNLHGFFILGPTLIVLAIVAERLERYRKIPWGWTTGNPLNRNQHRNLILVFLLSLLACLVNFNGIKGALYPLVIIVKGIAHPNAINKFIAELLPPWKLRFDLAFPYYLLLAVSFISFFSNLRKINLTYLLFWLVTLGISFNINRNIIFFNCVAYLVCVDNFSRSTIAPASFKNLLKIFDFAIKCLTFGAIIWFAFTYNLRSLNDRYYLFDRNIMKSYLLGVNNEFPDKAADFILKNKLPDNLFNIFNHGSYLIYRLYPKHHVFIDGRTELYNNQFHNDYSRILHGDTFTLDKLLEKYKINTIFLSGEIPALEELTGCLQQSQAWALVYLEEDGLIFIRQQNQNKAWVEQLRVDLDKREIKKAGIEKIGLRSVRPTPHIRLAQMFFNLGADQKAELQAKEALTILPNAIDPYWILGRIYLRKNRLDEAYQYLRLAAVYGPKHQLVLFALADYYLKTDDQKSAEKTYKKIIRLFPEQGKGYYLLGIYYADSGNLKEAAKYLRQAYTLAPYSTEYLNKFNEISAKIK